MPPGRFTVHSSFTHCVNFEDGVSLVSLVDETVGNGPFNIVTDADTFAGARSLVVTGESVAIDGTEHPLQDVARYPSTLDLRDPVPAPRVLANIRALERLLIADPPPRSLVFLLESATVAPANDAFERGVRQRCRDGLKTLRVGELAVAASIFRGTGYGLTPSGDDFLCGCMVASHLAQAVDGTDRSGMRGDMLGTALGSNLLSNTFLRAACQGWLHEPVKRLVLALAGTDEPALILAARRALAHGETSGADFAVGLSIGFNLWV